jgi:hypothetical protein
VADRDVSVDILANDRTVRATRSAERNFAQLKDKVDKSTKAGKENDKAYQKVAKSMAAAAKVAGKFAAKMAGIVSLVGPATIGLLKAAKGAVAFGKGLASVAPAAAVIPALLGSLALLVGFSKLVGPAFATAFSPFKAAFVDADGNATKLARHIQQLATAGVQSLAQKLVKLDLPKVNVGFEQIARSVNSVVVGVEKWLLTTDGQRLISTIIGSTARSAQILGPQVTAAAIALGRLAGRAGDPAIGGLTDLIGHLLDRFTTWANSTTTDDIRRSLEKLGSTRDKIKQLWDTVSGIGNWISTHQAAVKQFSDVLAGVALVIGAATLDLPAVVLGAFTLVTNHWSAVQKTLSGAQQWWSQTWQKIKNDQNLRDLGNAVANLWSQVQQATAPAIAKIKADVLPALQELGRTIHDQLLPAMTDFLVAVTPYVKSFVENYLPIMVALLTTVIKVINGVVIAFSGWLELFSGILTLNWTKIWDGYSTIVYGWATAVLEIFKWVGRQLAQPFIGAYQEIKAAIEKIMAWVQAKIFGGRKDLFNLGQGLVDGLIQGLLSRAGSVGAAISSLLDRAKQSVPSALRGALGFNLNLGGWYPAQVAAAAAPSAGGAFSGGGGRFTAGGGGGHWLVQADTNVTVQIGGRTIEAVARSEAKAAVRRYDRNQRVGAR